MISFWFILECILSLSLFLHFFLFHFSPVHTIFPLIFLYLKNLTFKSKKKLHIPFSVVILIGVSIIWFLILYVAGLAEVIIYSSPDDRRKNRGFCFLEYDSHKSASLAKRRLSTGRVKIFGCDIIVDWADPQEEPDNDTMSKVWRHFMDRIIFFY